jgi:4-hydroxy-tetrahydrodipicolinate reductase
MKIVLSGYGKMGKVVEQVAVSRGHQVVARLDQPADWAKATRSNFADAVVIDFSEPSAVVNNIRNCFDLKAPVVVGTTGWNDNLPTVRKWAEDEKQAILFASNFSLGVNILFEISRLLAKLLNQAPSYDISIEETHHIHKLDAPSGTAITIADIILSELKRKNHWINQPSKDSEKLQIISHRIDEIPGIHQITCESPADKLIIVHEAKDRSGLALGAVMAAEWLKGKTGFFGMKDMLGLG